MNWLPEQMIIEFYDSIWRHVICRPRGNAQLTVDVPEARNPYVVSAFALHPDEGLSLVTEPAQVQTLHTIPITDTSNQLLSFNKHTPCKIYVYDIVRYEEQNAWVQQLMTKYKHHYFAISIN